jgi:hypothetical protein
MKAATNEVAANIFRKAGLFFRNRSNCVGQPKMQM